ncbi:hypothetical protein CA13_39320 [Planctomycetes bacterium CA13]|uniref:Uncharacterized protein n=1 Tax=Novipirellula herctigrandis TaxID=2527986 RepID=A0A5C5Z501_9BACT|nr:hypothetical protein CA13_39320 [Planctomycetes bacterium CA13]
MHDRCSGNRHQIRRLVVVETQPSKINRGDGCVCSKRNHAARQGVGIQNSISWVDAWENRRRIHKIVTEQNLDVYKSAGRTLHPKRQIVQSVVIQIDHARNRPQTIADIQHKVRGVTCRHHRGHWVEITQKYVSRIISDQHEIITQISIDVADREYLAKLLL